ncbi:MAG: hypothetical protein KME31_23230 [Tolypothrix carrinoi HA7290-LM1]|nr:hypothetical protein [Tolypothrix carrinoi HA7290-LM1]
MKHLANPEGVIGNSDVRFFHYPIANSPLPISHYPFGFASRTPGATTEGTSATHWLLNAGNPRTALDSPFPITY